MPKTCVGIDNLVGRRMGGDFHDSMDLHSFSGIPSFSHDGGNVVAWVAVKRRPEEEQGAQLHLFDSWDFTEP